MAIREFTPEYREFMRSDAWAKVRAGALERSGWRCERCGVEKGSKRVFSTLQVHHLTYDRFGGREEPEDLEVLCELCHDQADKERRDSVSEDRYWRAVRTFTEKKYGDPDAIDLEDAAEEFEDWLEDRQ